MLRDLGIKNGTIDRNCAAQEIKNIVHSMHREDQVPGAIRCGAFAIHGSQ
ncbi:hypothetical protein [Burkholderia lata]|nr:hypothetical protein [Burkholderia lata]